MRVASLEPTWYAGSFGYQDAENGNDTYSLAESGSYANGNYRWIEDRAVAVRNEAGRAIRLVGAVSDVTARKATEQALRDSQERYSLVSQAV